MALVVTVSEQDVFRLSYPGAPGKPDKVILLRGNRLKGTSMRLEIQAEKEVQIKRLDKRPLEESLRDFQGETC